MDLFLFTGQSNMAGRGITCSRWPEKAPALIPGAGVEFRAISDPSKLYPIEEPFGAKENNPEGIYEPGMKTGSMVTAFCNRYYEKTGRPVFAISAAKGGSAISEWQGSGDYLSDALSRLGKAEAFIQKEGIRIEHRYVLWCQGETDGDLKTNEADYRDSYYHMTDQLKEKGIEKVFLITIGEYNGADIRDYKRIREVQYKICREDPFTILASDRFHTMKERGLMKDSFHYYQAAYNETGKDAAENTAEYLKTCCGK